MIQSWVICAVNLGLLLLIVLRGIRSGMSREYTVFYGYIGFISSAAVGQVLVALFLGVTSPQFYYSYHLPNLLVPLLQLWILWDLYRRSVGYAKSPWKELLWCASLAAMATAPIAWKVLSLKKADPFVHYHALTLPLQVVACLWVYRKIYADRRVDLGRNVKGIMLGLAVMLAFQSVNFAHYVFLDSSFQIFGFFVPFIYLVALVIFAYTLWDYVPVRRLQPSAREQFAKVNDQLEQVLKSLLLR